MENENRHSEASSADRPASEGQVDLVWFANCAAITALAIFLRFYWLGLKPFHHDEGVNGWFLTNLFREGVYRYDPANYHGPTLYYISLAFVEAFGLDTLPVRWSVAIWGVMIVVLAFYLRRYIGRVGALAAAFFLAISPGLVFISRYFIHEIFFVFLSLGLVLSMVLFTERRRAGPGAVAWLALVLFVCFLPPVIRIPALLAADGSAAIWGLRIALAGLEAALIYFVIRSLLDWNEGRPIYFLLAAACVALMFATKETAFITLGTMGIACLCIWAREQIRHLASRDSVPTKLIGAAAATSIAAALVLAYKLNDAGTDFGRRVFDLTGIGSAEGFTSLFYLLVAATPPLIVYLLYISDRGVEPVTPERTGSCEPTFNGFREGIGAGTDRYLLVIAAIALSSYLIVLFFSSFFTYADGVKGFFEAYAIWAKTGSKDHTQNGIWAYVDWGMRSDGPIMILGFAGALIALVRGRDRFAMFVGLWAVGLFVAYTIIPYKTPWLALSFLVPMCIAGGYAVNEFIVSAKPTVRFAGILVVAVSAVILSYLTYDLNFVRYDDEDAPMVYAHTSREFIDMVRDIENFAELSGKGRDASIDIVSPDYWPLVWYLKDYPKAIFHGRIADLAAEMIVAKKGEQDSEVIRKYSANYDYYASYKLRSGVDLVLLVRKDLAGRKGQELFKLR